MTELLLMDVATPQHLHRLQKQRETHAQQTCARSYVQQKSNTTHSSRAGTKNSVLNTWSNSSLMAAHCDSSKKAAWAKPRNSSFTSADKSPHAMWHSADRIEESLLETMHNAIGFIISSQIQFVKEATACLKGEYFPYSNQKRRNFRKLDIIPNLNAKKHNKE